VKQLTNILKFLSDENRLRMILLLYQEELLVCQLSSILDIQQPRISQNLSKLRDLNLVNDERKEKFVSYSLRRDSKMLIDILENILVDLEFYPQLVVDKNRLKNKEMYLNLCCPRND
jgi:ArsR family transcriptional regulator